MYRYSVAKLSGEFHRYDPVSLFTKYVAETLGLTSKPFIAGKRSQQKIY